MRYFPFFIISLIIYSLFFYHSQQPASLVIEENIATTQSKVKDKIITLDFKTQPQQVTNQPIKASEQAKQSSDLSISDNLAMEQLATGKPEVQEMYSSKRLNESISDASSTVENQLITAIDTTAPASQKTIATTETKLAVDNESTKIISEVAPESASKDASLKVPDELTTATEAALLKGEFYDDYFHLYISPPIAKKNTTKTKHCISAVLFLWVHVECT